MAAVLIRLSSSIPTYARYVLGVISSSQNHAVDTVKQESIAQPSVCDNQKCRRGMLMEKVEFMFITPIY